MMVNHTKRQPKKRKEKNGFVHVVKVNWCGIVRYKRSFAKKFSIPLYWRKTPSSMLQRWPPNILGKRIFRDSLVDYKRLKFYIHTENFLECSGRIPPLRQISPNCILRRDLLTSTRITST